MNHSLLISFISLLLVNSLAGTCMADIGPNYKVYIQGGESSITTGSDGVYVITVKDIVPFFHVTDGVISSLIPIKRLTILTYPVSAAMVLSGKGNETTVMARVVNVSLSDKDNILTVQANPLKYNDGKFLTSFTNISQSLDTIVGSQNRNIALYLEGVVLPEENGFAPYCTCEGGQIRHIQCTGFYPSITCVCPC